MIPAIVWTACCLILFLQLDTAQERVFAMTLGFISYVAGTFAWRWWNR